MIGRDEVDLLRLIYIKSAHTLGWQVYPDTVQTSFHDQPVHLQHTYLRADTVRACRTRTQPSSSPAIMPEPTKYLDRPIPTISLADFDNRIDEITSQLVSAAENIGFFSIIDHGISPDQVHAIFTESARFFSLPDTIKATVPFSSQHNSGWESKSQIRPSTGAADNKESYQMQFSSHHMSGKWLSDSILPNFQPNAMSFMHQCQTVSAKLMICFARGLGFPDTYFLDSHDSTRPDCQTVCRLLHYFETPRSSTNGETRHRAGAHTDWDLLTLLFQKAGQSGLEICPGREASTDFAIGDVWTKVEPSVSSNAIICNIVEIC